MTKADSVLSTPRTTASKINPPVDPTRRRLLTVAAGGAVAAAIPVAALPIAAAARFERLLDEYYARRSVWSQRLALAHAETDEVFGDLWNEHDAEDRSRFFSEACAHLEVDEVSDRMHAVGEEMKPLARAIIALPTTSLEVLRAKALVTFWQVAPLCAGDTEYHFGDAYPFQLLFSAVAESCGLAHKVTAKGYTLPELPDIFSPYSEDDEEEA